MFCDRCGTQLQVGQSFCPKCGKAFAAVPMMPKQGRIAGHVRLLGIFWVALSAFRLIPAAVLLFISQPELHIFPADVPEFVPMLLRTLGLLLLAGGAAGIAAGWGLLQRQPWARMLAIVLGCISLFDMPFGTALGIYSLWVLLPAKSEEEYRQIAQAA
jgi:zinc-ribbon domain